ncbi:MAG: sugar ABC transporter ATP-binding protein [Clostridiales bacterium]|nr:sugar ABC transporter ATP-binding protein [Clostridiales bacterium]
MENILATRNINKSFGTAHVLRDVSFDLRPGEIHGLIGENGAGKSTLMKIIGGDYTLDSGELFYEDEPVIIASPSDSLALGIRIIYQEFNLAGSLTVAENIYMGDLPRTKNGLVDWKEMYRQAEELLARLGILIDVRQRVSDISVAEQQLVEIAKALHREARVLIMDEPTAALSDQETDKLFGIVRGLREMGISIVFITHRLSEQFALSDRITVLRDGQTVGTLDIKDATNDILVKMMVGRDLADLYPRNRTEPGEIIFEASGLEVDERIKDISFNIREGEIVTFFGLMGAGQDEICKAILGDPPLRGGTMKLHGEGLIIENLRQANEKGLGYVTSDRREEGLIPVMGLQGNITLAALKKLFGKTGLIKDKTEYDVAGDWIDRLGIRCSSQMQQIALLSGGNQQKAMIARWLTNEIKLLILNLPTRGVDVGAKVEIYKLLEELANQGVAILVFSLELPEVLGISDRIYVLCEGEVTAEVPIGEADQDILMKHAVAKFLHLGGKEDVS